jgi:hypothetical protein
MAQGFDGTDGDVGDGDRHDVAGSVCCTTRPAAPLASRAVGRGPRAFRYHAGRYLAGGHHTCRHLAGGHHTCRHLAGGDLSRGHVSGGDLSRCHVSGRHVTWTG